MIWTDDRQTELKRLMADGFSYREAADTMSMRHREPVSRNAIAGICFRLKIEPLVREKVVQTAKTRPVVAHKPKVEKRRPVPRVKPALPVVEAPPLVPSCDAVAPLNLSLAENNGCRFITVGTGIGARYCGHMRIAGKSWCSDHATIVFRKPGEVDADV